MRNLFMKNVLRTMAFAFLFIFVAGISDIFAQGKSVNGIVKDNDGVTLPGVTVVIKGQAIGTTSDIDGRYNINVPSDDVILVFSFIGMKSVEVPVGSNTSIDVVLEYDVIGLEEVVAIGYGTLQKREITNSITSIKSDDFKKGAIKSVGELVQGKVAGLVVSTVSGSPTSSPEILLRGVGTLKSGVSPLVIIDGIPGDLSTVAPEDIESIDVLKDGSAAAIYGTRGSNGVILISTRKVHGKTPTTVEFTTYFTTEQITRRLEFLDGDAIRQMAADGNIYAIDYGYDTDWQDLIFQTPVSQNYNLSLRGGDSQSSYYANINYKGSDGLIKRSDNNVLNTRLEMSNSMFDNRFRTNANIVGRMQYYYPGDFGTVYEKALIRNPTDRAVDDEGNWVEYTAMNRYENPLPHLYEKEGEVRNTTLKAYGNAALDIIDGLELKLTGSIEDYNSLSGYSYSHDHIRTVKSGEGGSATRSTLKSRTKVFESTLRYTKEFNNVHNVNLLLGHSWQDNTYESFSAYNHLFPTDYYDWNNLGAGQGLVNGTATMSSYKSSSKLIGYFFRANYSFDNRYMFMASLRREGSSKFGENHKWGFFPAVSAGWNIKNESFMENVELVSSLKLRAGYGLTGTIPSSPYNALRKLTYDNSSYVLSNGEWISPLTTTSNPNPDLRWEKKAETNLGIDFGIFNDRLAGSVDLYYRKTTDIIWDYAVPSPPNLYTSVVANAGSMENKGIEVNLSAQPVKTTDWLWNTSVNYSSNKNKLLSLSNEDFQNNNPYINIGDAGGAIREYTHKLEEGGPIGNFYGYKSIGVDENGMWLVETDDGPKLLLDAVEADKQVIGNGIPKHYLNWNNSVSYKNFDLDVVMRGAFKFQILNQAKMLHGVPSELRRFNVLANAFDPVYGQVLSMDQDATYVSDFLEKGDYWKIDNVTLGYNLEPGEKISFLSSLRVFASVSNILTLTGYSGIDPEVTTTNINGRAPGYDYVSRYPNTRTYTIGITVEFK